MKKITIAVLVVCMVLVAPCAHADTIYAKKTIRLLDKPKAGSKTVYKVAMNTKLNRIRKGKNYSEIKYHHKLLYAKNSGLSKKRVTTYSASYFRKMGVINWGGRRWTWYSQRVLAGGGLKIKGRHVEGRYVVDGDGYICLASDSLKYGTVINTPFLNGRKGKIYDCGVGRNDTIDVYTDF